MAAMSSGENSETLGRRRLFGLSGALVLGSWAAAGCSSSVDTMTNAVTASAGAGGPANAAKSRVSAPPPNGVLGANFNGEPASVTDRQLRDAGDTWLRGFVPTQELDNHSPLQQATVHRLLDAGSRGYGTLLSLKFPYSNKPIPAPGEPGMDAELRRLDALLPAVLDKVDILEIGNEPFIESRSEDQKSGRVNAFYEAIAQHIVGHKAGAGKTRFYMGSLNHLDLPEWRTAATERWMTFVRQTPEISGVDIHPHLPAPGVDKQYTDYILPRMRDDQKFLVTEFSLVLFWQKHLRDPIAKPFAEQYGIDPSKKVWQVIKQAIAKPFPQQQWEQFMASNPWFANQHDYLRNQVERFRRTGKLAVATYGVTQGASMTKNFGPDSTPWLLNSLYCPFTVRREANGLPGGNQAWLQQFRDLQKG